MSRARREFPFAVKQAASARAGDNCEYCGLPFGGRRKEFHHVKEDFFDGEPTLENCAVLCPPCHRIETSKAAPRMAKTRRQANKAAGIKSKGRPMPGSRASGLRKRMDGTVERR